MTKIIDPATNPSMPSIKFIKFMIPIKTKLDINQKTILIIKKWLSKKLLKIQDC